MSKRYTVMELEAIKKLCKCVNLVANLPADLIADTNVATNTTYSSYKIDAKMSALENDVQAYVDYALAGLNKLTKEVIYDKTLVVKENVLYLYKDPTDMNNDYMQMMLINGTVVELGNTTCDMSGYYTNTEVDDKFALKIDLDVLTTSFNNLVTSVKKKIDKDKIVTALDNTVTDEQVASAKATYDLASGLQTKTDKNLVTTSKEVVGAINEVKILNDTKLNKTDANKLNCVTIDNVSLKEYILTNFTGTDKTYYLIAKTTCTDLPKASNFYITVETPGMYTYKVTAKELNDSNGIYVCTYRTLSSSWSAWQELATMDKIASELKTSSNTDKVIITPNTEYFTQTVVGQDSFYVVRNGVCYVNLDIVAVKLGFGVFNTILPKPISSINITISPYNVATDASNKNAVLNLYPTGITESFSVLEGQRYMCNFSYPIAE